MNICISVSRFLASLAPRRKRSILPETGLAVEMQPPSPVADPLWLLFCINGSNLATLQHLDLCMTKSDYELFTCLKTRYLFLRSKVAFARSLFLGLSKIHFVQVSALSLLRMILFIIFQFQLLPRAYVDGIEVDRLPPPDRVDYVYKAVASKPPVPPRWMLHVYKHPEMGSEITFCLDRFPKKRNEKLRFEQDLFRRKPSSSYVCYSTVFVYAKYEFHIWYMLDHYGA
jgi:hypothetical protein